ncbi:MAG TPA: hypothetical protein VE028_03840 [Nitratidesulfovibrio sp.]|nr:hypothetical protein [Nitratidesulfovibrio sp.]
MSKNENIIVNNRRTHDFQLKPASGAVCGITPTGEVHIEFFIEHVTTPSETKIIVKNGAKIGEEHLDDSPSLVREIHSGLIISATNAYSIGNLLMEKGKEAIDALNKTAQ